ncbi:MAG TPA: hypothetical protein VI911_01025 [Patescibacteria group bacterium]|nr:hypothetical protein [Patescibacteria group bacterium]
MADGLGLFGKNNRNKDRKQLGSILDAFNQMKMDLASFVEEKTGHISRLDKELAQLAGEKHHATKDMEKAMVTKTNIEKLMGESGNSL